MRLKIRTIVLTLLAISSITKASVTLDHRAGDEYITQVWTLSALNAAQATITGSNDPTATGTFSGVGTIAAETVTLTFTAGTSWNATSAQSAIAGGTFSNYLANLTPGGISAIIGHLGVYDGTNEGDTTFNNQGEVMLIRVEMSDPSTPLLLEKLSFSLMNSPDRTDFMLYDASSNSAMVAEWDMKYDGADSVSGNWTLNNGDIIVLAVGASNGNNSWRLDNITVDIPLDLEGDGRVRGITTTPANSVVLLNWPVVTALDRASYNIYRSTTSGSNYVQIATGLTTNNYLDAHLSNNITYYYSATAVSSLAIETDHSDEVSATPTIPIPTGLNASFGDMVIDLDWDDATDALFSSFSVYRSTTSGTNYTLIASHVVDSHYTDTSVRNEITYFYTVRHVDLFDNESANSAEIATSPSSDLILVNLINDQQGEALVVASTDGTYEEIGSQVNAGRMKAGEYIAGTLARPILKFPLTRSDLGTKTTNDIDRIVLRMYLNENLLSSSPATELEVYGAQDEAVNQAVVAADFENPSYTKIGTWSSIDETSPAFAWYEFDVTDMVLNDLANDIQDSSAGACFRLQLSGDTSFLSTDNDLPDYGGIVVTRFNDNSSMNPPELRIKWETQGIWPPWIIGDPSDDDDNDGFNNLSEYALGGDPTNSAFVSILPILSATESGLNYVHLQRTNDPSLSYTLEATTNLITGVWTNLNYSVRGTDDAGENFIAVTKSISLDHDKQFIRMKITYEQ